jgi:hypothetical protein
MAASGYTLSKISPIIWKDEIRLTPPFPTYKRILDAGTFSPKVDFPDSDSKDPYVQQRIQGERQLLTGLGALLQPDRAFGKSETFQTEGGRKIGKYDSDSGYKHVFDVWTGGGGVSVGVENPQIVESAFKSNAVK